MNDHPSFLALDRHALGAAQPEVAAHVEGCAACAAHVRAIQTAAPLPDEVRALPPRRSVWRWRLPRLAIVPVLAAATAALILLVARPPPPAPDTQPKGLPAAVLWVKHGGTTAPWRGQRLVPGDAVRFEVAPAGYSHLYVVERGAPPRVLHLARLHPGSPALTPAWALDASGSEEALAVVLTRDPLDAAALTGALCQVTRETWSRCYTLEKETP